MPPPRALRSRTASERWPPGPAARATAPPTARRSFQRRWRNSGRQAGNSSAPLQAVAHAPPRRASPDGPAWSSRPASRSPTCRPAPACRQTLRRDISFDYVLCRNVSGLVVRAEINPNAAVPVGRQFEAGHGNAANSRFVGADQMALDPVTTRSISSVSAGTILSSACITIGTRRTIPSRSGRMLKSPRPAAACSSLREISQDIREMRSDRGWDRGRRWQSRFGQLLESNADRTRGCPPARAPRFPADRLGEDLVIARQVVQPSRVYRRPGCGNASRLRWETSGPAREI